MVRFFVLAAYCSLIPCYGGEPSGGEPGRTTLSNRSLPYRVPRKHYVVLQRADVTAVIVDNAAVDDAELKDHQAGYSGVALLKHKQRAENLFVPRYAGLNFEHIHDGTRQDRDILFEPRRAPMELRVLGPHAVELYQKPTPHWGLESALRYEMLEDGAIEMTLECVPRKRAFKHGYIGLFWASYIHQPESLDIHFLGWPNADEKNKPAKAEGEPRWVRGVTPRHGVLSTHVGRKDLRRFTHDEGFPLTLVFNRSRYRYAQPWYYGVSHGMAFVQMFRPRDGMRLTQSPSGGGGGNPAWDFQHFIPHYETGKLYRMVMRAMYTPYVSPEQIINATRPHRQALAQGGAK